MVIVVSISYHLYNWLKTTLGNISMIFFSHQFWQKKSRLEEETIQPYSPG